MKIFFYNEIKTKTTTYIYKLLEYLANYYGHEVTNIDNCDIICASMSSISEIEMLRRIYKVNKGKKKIIVGGHISYTPIPLLAYSDYVNIGQGFEFFRDINKTQDIEGTFNHCF